MLAIMFEITSPFRWRWWRSAYSMARIPPHECPSRKKLSAVQPQRLPHLLDFVDEAVEVPQVGVVGLVAVGRAELVVVVVLDARRRQVAVGRLEILVGRRRAAVEEEELRGRVVADALGPDPELTLGRGDGDQLHPAAEQVVAT